MILLFLLTGAAVGVVGCLRRILAEIRNKIDIVWSRLKEEALLREIRAELAKQQVLERENYKIRHETRILQQELEQELEKAQECELWTKARIENMNNKESVAADQRHSDTMASMNAELESYASSFNETEAEIVRIREQIVKKKESQSQNTATQ
jgi:hypothetical protein